MKKLPAYFSAISLGLILLVGIIYYPGLSGGFVLDDYSNILHQPNLAIQEWSWAELKRAAFSLDTRPLPRLTFGIHHLIQGEFDPYWFKLINLLIHSLSTILVFSIAFLLTQTASRSDSYTENSNRTLVTSAFIALAWALHPVNLTSVLYSIQRMNSMSAMFVFAGILVYISGRRDIDLKPVAGWIKIFSSVIIFTPLAWFSKENGALLPLFLFIIEITILGFTTNSEKNRKLLYIFYLLFLVIPFFLAVYYVLQHPGGFHKGFVNRNFTVIERLLTEARVIWMYIRMILLPTPDQFSLFHDDVQLSRSLTEPLTTLFSIAGIILLSLIALFSRKKYPVLSFGILFFLAGHLMESTFIPLELVYEHRNYLPAFGLIFMLFYSLSQIGRKNNKVLIAYTSMLSLIFLYTMNTHLRVNYWSSDVRFYLTEAELNPDSPRANYEAGKVFGQLIETGNGDLQENYKQAIFFFSKSTQLSKNSISGLFGNILAAIDTGNTIRMEWIDEIIYRISKYPIEAVSVTWLSGMTRCIDKGKCPAGTLHLDRILKAALNNTSVSASRKAMLYLISAEYAYVIDNDIEQAIFMNRHAIQKNPADIKLHLNLINYLIKDGDYKEAGDMLEILKNGDDYARYKATIDTLDHNLIIKQQ